MNRGRLPESAYSDLFVLQHGGTREARVRFGRIDVLTATHAIEVEPFASWAHGARQAMAYAHQVNRLGGSVEPAVAVYGDLSTDVVLRLFEKASGLLDLFVLREVSWDLIRTRTAARRWIARVGRDEDVIDAIDWARRVRGEPWPFVTPEMREAVERLNAALQL